MAVVIRLQGLPIVAGTMDIRHFFSGLTIPDGGVHIVGGEHPADGCIDHGPFR